MDWDETRWLHQQNRNNGLGFRFLHATPDTTEYLNVLPPGRKLNVLVSAYRLLGRRGGPIWRNIDKAQRVFLDSGVISLLKLAKKASKDAPKVSKLEQDECGFWRFVRDPEGIFDNDADWEAGHAEWFGPYDKVADWISDQGKLQETAWRLHHHGVRHGFAAMMDHPCEPHLLASVGVTVDQAIDATIYNAWDWYGNAELPHGWKKVYVCQGWQLEDYERCLEAFQHYGILDEVRQGYAWLAAGSTCMRKPTQKNGPGLYDVYELIRGYLGVDGHLHALGIAKPEWVRHMRDKGWIQSADSATASMTVGFNRGPYAVAGKRTKKHLAGQFANTMTWLEEQIA